jgi:hypothetical protein
MQLNLLKKREDPLERYNDDGLGLMVWSEDDEAWGGEYGGIKYLIGYDSQATPRSDLLAYARSILDDVPQLKNKIEQAKEIAIAENAGLAKEITLLRIESVFFYHHKERRRILASLAGGLKNRLWRVEFEEDKFEGIGFDD